MATSPGQRKSRARFLRALAHPSRLRIVEELARGERCVCELAQIVGTEMPTVSRHLAILRQAGLVDDQRRGARVFYRLANPRALDLFRCLERLERAAHGKESAHVV